MQSFKSLIAVVMLFLFGSPLVAHGDLHERIVALSKQIEMYPDSAELYFIRGSLLLQHEEFEKSLEDFNSAEAKGFNTIEIEYQKAVVYFNLKDYPNCLKSTDQVIYRDQDHVRATRLKAKAYMELKEYGKASIFFNHVLLKAKEKLPENYIEAATAYELLGGEMAIQKSENILNEGIDKLGKLISFYNKLVYLATLERDFEKIIGYQTEILHLLDRKERAYYNRALSYALNRQYDKGLDDLKSAKKCIRSLKKKFRKQQEIIDLLNKIEEEELRVHTILNKM